MKLSGPANNGNVWSSLTMTADSILYMLNQSGDTFVFRADLEFQLLATNSLDETTNSSMVVPDGDLLIRTHKHLWCIGEKN